MRRAPQIVPSGPRAFREKAEASSRGPGVGKAFPPPGRWELKLTRRTHLPGLQ